VLKIKQLVAIRLTVHRTPQHIYAQLIDVVGKVLACASTLDPEVKKEAATGSNVKAAAIVGKHIAARGVKAGISKVAF